MIKAVLFDLDGTLINTNNLILQSFKYAFKTHLNLEVEDKKIINYFGQPLKKSLGEYGEENLEGLTKNFKEFNEKMHDELATEYEDIKETICTLKDKGIKIGIVTSKRELMTNRSLKLINIYDHMDIVITPEKTEKHKPNPEPLYEACKQLGINPEDTIMVGDSVYDIQCGINAGAETCAVSYTEFSLDDIKKLNPGYIVDNIKELVDIIDDKNKKESGQ